MFNTNATVDDQKRQIRNHYMREYFKYMELSKEVKSRLNKNANDYEYWHTMYYVYLHNADYYLRELRKVMYPNNYA